MKTLIRRGSVVSLVFFLWISSNNAQEKYNVVLPEGYSTEKTYPLFIVFHGGNGNMKEIMEWWNSPLLRDSFIVAYMEAATLDRAPDRWGWRNFPDERKNIRNYYMAINQQFNVNDQWVFAGGFSLGAKISVDLAMNQVIPVRGFISVNHGGRLSSDSTIENFNAAATMGIRGVLIGGQNDAQYLNETSQLQELCENAGLAYKYIINLGVGHEAPPHFDMVLDQYISFLFE